MSATNFLNAAFHFTVIQLGGELITINGHQVRAVLGQIREMEDLMLGAEGDHRELSLTYPTDALPFVPQKNQSAHARGEDWKIHTVDSHPGTSTTLLLHSPARR